MTNQFKKNKSIINSLITLFLPFIFQGCVENKAPTAQFEFTKKNNADFTFDATKSSDIDGTIVKYSWNFGDGKTFVTTSSPTVEHHFKDAGNYEVFLTVEDNLGLKNQISMNVPVIENVIIGELEMNGSGCPQGTARATLAPDNSAVSIAFDEFLTSTDGQTSIDFKNCTLALPLKAPSGYSISIYQFDYRGFASIPEGAKALFKSKYYFAGLPEDLVLYENPFTGPYEQDFFVYNSVQITNEIETECGADEIFKIELGVQVESNDKKEITQFFLDTLDSTGQIIYHVSLNECER